MQGDRVVTGAEERAVKVRPVDREKIESGVPVVMTMHRARETDSSRVVLFGMDKGSIPAVLGSQRYVEHARQDAQLRQRSLPTSPRPGPAMN